MISHSRVWSQNMLLFDPLLVFLGTARMKDGQLQTSQEDGKGGNESTNRSQCLLQPEPLEVWYFLYILSPKEGTPFLKRQKDREKQIISDTCSTPGDSSLLPQMFLLSRLATSKVLNSNSTGSWMQNYGQETTSPVRVMKWISSANPLVAWGEQVRPGAPNNNCLMRCYDTAKPERKPSSPPNSKQEAVALQRPDLLYLLFRTLWLLTLPPLSSVATAGC